MVGRLLCTVNPSFCDSWQALHAGFVQGGCGWIFHILSDLGPVSSESWQRPFYREFLHDIADNEHDCVIKPQDAVSEQDPQVSADVTNEIPKVIGVDMLLHWNIVFGKKERNFPYFRLGLVVRLFVNLGRVVISFSERPKSFRQFFDRFSAKNIFG